MTKRLFLLGSPEIRADGADPHSRGNSRRQSRLCGCFRRMHPRYPLDEPLQSLRPVPVKAGAFVFPLKEVTPCSKANRRTKSMH